MKNLKTLGKKIETYRLSLEWTQAYLAQKAGISKRTVERVEKGEAVQLPSFLSILEAFDLAETLLDVIPIPQKNVFYLLEEEQKTFVRKRASNKRRERMEEGGNWAWEDEK